MQSLFFSSSFIILSFLFLYFILNMKLSITQIKNGLEQITHSHTLTLSKMLNQQQRNERSTTNDKWKLDFFFRIKKNESEPMEGLISMPSRITLTKKEKFEN